MTRDPHKLVARGYDQMAQEYARWTGAQRDAEREFYTRLLLERLPPGARLLELGCGSGLPTTARLADQLAVTGVDISAAQLRLARRNVPRAKLRRADLTDLAFPPGSFEAVAAFYVLNHLRPAEQPVLLERITGWLVPGGLLVASFGTGGSEWEGEWLGVPMYFGSKTPEETLADLVRAGLRVDSARVETAEEDGKRVGFLWVVAEKPA